MLFVPVFICIFAYQYVILWSLFSILERWAAYSIQPTGCYRIWQGLIWSWCFLQQARVLQVEVHLGWCWDDMSGFDALLLSYLHVPRLLCLADGLLHEDRLLNFLVWMLTWGLLFSLLEFTAQIQSLGFSWTPIDACCSSLRFCKYSIRVDQASWTWLPYLRARFTLPFHLQSLYVRLRSWILPERPWLFSPLFGVRRCFNSAFSNGFVSSRPWIWILYL